MKGMHIFFGNKTALFNFSLVYWEIVYWESLFPFEQLSVVLEMTRQQLLWEKILFAFYYTWLKTTWWIIVITRRKRLETLVTSKLKCRLLSVIYSRLEAQDMWVIWFVPIYLFTLRLVRVGRGLHGGKLQQFLAIPLILLNFPHAWSLHVRWKSP